jgi:hypothetical protein
LQLQATEIAEAFWADARLLHGASSRLQEVGAAPLLQS